MTAPAVPEGLEPLGTWDAKDRPPGWTDAHTRELVAWSHEHIGDPSAIYRVEFYDLKPPLARVHRFATDEDGRKYRDQATGEPVTELTAVVPLAELPPAHLLKG